jgi:hypothetical protein
MIRTFVSMLALGVAVLFVTADCYAQNQTKAKNNQMVAGTIKSIDIGKGILVINQKVGNEKVDRELSISEDVEFDVAGKLSSGVSGMGLLKVGANVKVKCDKDVKVLKVTSK